MKKGIILSLTALLGVAPTHGQTNSPAMAAAPAAASVAASQEPTVVTSDRLQVDYAHNVGTFEGNVLAVDPRITLRADKVIAYFGSDTNGSRQVQRMLAQGSVVISQDERKATSEQAEYLAAEGKVVLTGNPKVQSPQGTISGKRITFWQGQEKMDVESDLTDTNRTRLIFYPEDKGQSTGQPAP